MLKDKRIFISGGTGSLGKVLVRRLLSEQMGKPKSITIFSRDETKQYAMRLFYQYKAATTDDVIYRNAEQLLRFHVGDVRDYHAVNAALREADVVFNAAALKQVPTCEHFPFEAVQTNIIGAENIVRAIRENKLPVETVVGVSTDKACKPINVMGMTKAIQERILAQANMDCQHTRFVCVRYGNVLASRGSVIPLFHYQIRNGGPVTITTREMTRFLISTDEAVDLVFAAVQKANKGETFIPRVPSARVADMAEVLIGDRPVETVFTGIRPGEKIHEILVSEEEVHRTVQRGNQLVIMPIHPELRTVKGKEKTIESEYSSVNNLITKSELGKLLKEHKLLVDDRSTFDEDLIA
jgi:FlaA1/EpsC-like NDP-sugar epimerase